MSSANQPADNSADRVPIFIVQPLSASLQKLQSRLEKSEGIEVIICARASEAVSQLRQRGRGVFISHLEKWEDQMACMPLLKILQDLSQKNQARVLLTSTLKQHGFYPKLEQVGAEILQEPLTEKAFQFKLDRHLKTLAKSKKSNAPAALAQKQKEAQAAQQQQQQGRSGFGGRANKSNTVNMGDPLSLKSDCWLMQASSAKKVMGSWVMKVFGPGPGAGRWVDEGGAGGGDRKWKWVPTEEGKQFIVDPGVWIFKGNRPEFQEEMWNFIGKNAELVFVHEGKGQGAKISVQQDGSLLVAKDSPAAIAFRPAIYASFELTLKEKDGAEGDEKDESGRPKKRGLGGAGKSGSGEEGKKAEVKFSDPLKLKSDCWILAKEGSAKRVLDKWIIKLMGPGPMAGRWTEMESKDASEPYWKWVPTDPENDPFIVEEGGWVFRGNRPEFQEITWSFVGKSPKLFFFHNGNSYGAKLQVLEDGNLQVAKDSEAAIKLLPAIYTSLELVIKQKGGKEAEELEKKIKESQEQSKQLEGEIKGEKEKERKDLEVAAEPVSTEEVAIEQEAPKKKKVKKKRKKADGTIEEVEVEEETAEEPEKKPAAKSKAVAEEEASAEGPGPKTPKKKKEETKDSEDFVDIEKKKAGEINNKLKPEGKKKSGINNKIGEDEKKESPEDFVDTPDGKKSPKQAKKPTPEKKSKDLEGPESDSPEPGQINNKLKKEKQKANNPEAKESADKAEPDKKATQKKKTPEVKAPKEQEEKESPKAKAAKESLEKPEKKEEKKKERGAKEESSEKAEELEKEAAPKAESEEEAPELEKEGKAAALKEKKEKEGKPLADAAVKALARAERKFAKRKEREKQKAEAQAQPDAAPEEVKPEKPLEPLSGPKLGPLAMGLFISEIMSKRDWTREQIAQRLCVYVSSSCSQVRAELWSLKNAQWTCLATSDQTPGQFQEIAIKSATPGSVDPVVRDSEIAATPVLTKDKNALGALVLSGAGTSMLEVPFLMGIAEMVIGLLRG